LSDTAPPSAREVARKFAREPARDAPIGVFDSGIGGLSVLRALRAQLPAEHFVYLADSAHAPYGERGDAYVGARSLALARVLAHEHGAKALVVACNTATGAAIATLRQAYPGLPIVGIEPALKPAQALSRSGRIAVWATRGTLAGDKFALLLRSLPAGTDWVLTPCDGLADAIEAAATPGAPRDAVLALCQRYADQSGPFGPAPGQADLLVLGCTHYPLASSVIRQAVGPAVTLVEPGPAVARQLQRLLAERALTRDALEVGHLTLLSTGAPEALQTAAALLLPQT